MSLNFVCSEGSLRSTSQLTGSKQCNWECVIVKYYYDNDNVYLTDFFSSSFKKVNTERECK